MAAPVAESQNLMVLSQLHDTMVLPVGSKQTPVTRSAWPVIVERQVDVERSHSLTVLSHEPVTRTLGSSGLKAREDTAAPCPLTGHSGYGSNPLPLCL